MYTHTCYVLLKMDVDSLTCLNSENQDPVTANHKEQDIQAYTYIHTMRRN